MSYIEVKNVIKEYGGKTGTVMRALDEISFEIEQGEFAVIVGPSGAGKTTVLNMLGGMDTITSGSIMVDGTDISKYTTKELTKYRRFDVGFVFQFYNLIPNFTALENVELASQISHERINAEEVLKEVGLEHRMDHFPSQLSGGEQQRVSIARALAKKPKLMLCDEPTGALDYNTGKTILKLLWEMRAKTGMTIVLITHNLAIAPMADRVIKIKNGKAVENTVNHEPVPIDQIEW